MWRRTERREFLVSALGQKNSTAARFSHRCTVSPRLSVRRLANHTACECQHVTSTQPAQEMGEKLWKHCFFEWLTENFAGTLREGNAGSVERTATRSKSCTTPEEVPLPPALSARHGALFSVYVKWRSEQLTRSYLRGFVVDPVSLDKYFGTCGDSHNSGCLVSCRRDCSFCSPAESVGSFGVRCWFFSSTTSGILTCGKWC